MKEKEKGSFIEKLSQWSQKYIPDALPLVLVLTFVVAALAMGLTGSSPIQLAQYWYDGFWSLLGFTINIVMLMFTGFLVANSRPVAKGLSALAKKPKTTKSAVLLFMVVTIVLFYIHFALGMAAAIVFGKALIVEQNKKGNKLPIGLIAAAAGFCIVFQAGPTASAPLTVSSPGHFMEDVIGVITMDKTMFTLPIILMNVVMMAIFLVVFPRLAAKHESSSAEDEEILARLQRESETAQADNAVVNATFADKVDNFGLFQMILGAVGLVLVIIAIAKGGLSQLGFNSVNMFFFTLAMILNRTPAGLARAARESISSVTGVVLQFPFYAGIFGILNASGLGQVLTEFFVSISSPRMFTTIVLWFSSLLNMIVPSGGSQFVVEAPYIMPAALELGVDAGKVVSAFTCGDLLTNLIQPFWAIPVLSAFGVKFRKIFPYCLIAFLIAFVVVSGTFLFFAF